MDVTAKQAAQLLGVTDRTVQRYITNGKLIAKRHGLRMFVINLDELRKFAIANNLVFDESLAQQLGQ